MIQKFPKDEYEARMARTLAWERACAGQLTAAELYAELDRLRQGFGDELYRHERLGRR